MRTKRSRRVERSEKFGDKKNRTKSTIIMIVIFVVLCLFAYAMASLTSSPGGKSACRTPSPNVKEKTGLGLTQYWQIADGWALEFTDKGNVVRREFTTDMFGYASMSTYLNGSWLETIDIGETFQEDYGDQTAFKYTAWSKSLQVFLCVIE